MARSVITYRNRMFAKTIAAALLLGATVACQAADFSWSKAKEALPKFFAGGDRKFTPIGYNVESPTKVWVVVFVENAGTIRVPAYYLQGEPGVGRWFLVSERSPDSPPVAID